MRVHFNSTMPLQLYDLPFDMLEMIGKSYDDLAQREAASTLPKTPSPNPLCVQCLVQPFSVFQECRFFL